MRAGVWQSPGFTSLIQTYVNEKIFISFCINYSLDTLGCLTIERFDASAPLPVLLLRDWLIGLLCLVLRKLMLIGTWGLILGCTSTHPSHVVCTTAIKASEASSIAVVNFMRTPTIAAVNASTLLLLRLTSRTLLSSLGAKIPTIIYAVISGTVLVISWLPVRRAIH
jgi:hypothetical protein